MTPDHVQENRLLEDIRSYFGYAEDQLEFVWNEAEGVQEVALFTYNPRHTHRFLFHRASGSTKEQALHALLEYTQWRVAGGSELHTSYFSAGNILLALDKFFAGRDPHTVQVFSVTLNPLS